MGTRSQLSILRVRGQGAGGKGAEEDEEVIFPIPDSRLPTPDSRFPTS